MMLMLSFCGWDSGCRAGLEGGTCFLRSHNEMELALLQRGLLPPGQTASDVPCKAWRQVFQVNEMPERRLSEKEGSDTTVGPSTPGERLWSSL